MLGLRIGMGVAIAVVIGAGYHLAGKLERDSQGRIADYSQAAPEEKPEVDEAPKDDRAFAEQAFDQGVIADAAALGVSADEVVASVRAAQTYALELDKPTSLAPGRSWSSAHLEIEAKLDKVKYQRGGATVSARHALAVVENISNVPIAYRVVVTSEARGRCDVHGSRQHNAMALMPGEQAEIVVCAGGGKIRVLKAEILEISELGHRYLSRVPPRAVGIDSLSSVAHVPPQGTRLCETVDVAGLGRSLRDGTIRWVDVADFYSRHSCDRFRYVPGYRHADGGPGTLPAKPPGP